MEFQRKDKYSMDDLLEIMKILRAPGGCPWDREQTHQSIRNCFIEETYEAVEAIDTKTLSCCRRSLRRPVAGAFPLGNRRGRGPV